MDADGHISVYTLCIVIKN